MRSFSARNAAHEGLCRRYIIYAKSRENEAPGCFRQNRFSKLHRTKLPRKGRQNQVNRFQKRTTEAGEEDYDKLRAEVTRLRKELREQKMRAEALDTMIDVAEEMFNIPVRKKAGTKQ